MSSNPCNCMDYGGMETIILQNGAAWPVFTVRMCEHGCGLGSFSGCRMPNPGYATERHVGAFTGCF